MIFDYQSGAEKKSTDVLPRCRLSFSVTLKFDYRCRHKKISTDIQQRSTFDVTFRNMTANVTPEKISTDVLPRCRLSFRVTLKFDYRCRPEKISTDVLSRSKFSLSQKFDYQCRSDKIFTDVLPRNRYIFSVTLKFDYRCRPEKYLPTSCRATSYKEIDQIRCHFEIVQLMSPQKNIYRRPTENQIQSLFEI